MLWSQDYWGFLNFGHDFFGCGRVFVEGFGKIVVWWQVDGELFVRLCGGNPELRVSWRFDWFHFFVIFNEGGFELVLMDLW